MNDLQFMPHQEEVLNLTDDKNRCAYYLDMGLGKTFVGAEKMYLLNNTVNLIVCQKSKVDDWVDHMKTYYPEYRVMDLTKKSEGVNFRTLVETKDLYDQNIQIVGVINYDLVFRRKYIAHITDFTLLLDESSLICNENAKRSKFILKLQPESVILLSGTPTVGKYERLWSQLKLLGWDINKKAFYASYVQTEWIENGDGYKKEVITGYKHVEHLKKRLTQFGAVFMKTEEVIELPEQTEQKIFLKITNEYKFFIKHNYLELDTRNLVRFKDDSDFEGEDVTPRVELIGDNSLTKTLYCRQLCGQWHKEKLEAFRDLLESTEDRLIVFYNFNEELTRLRKICESLNREVSFVNGSGRSMYAYECVDNSVTFVQYQAGAICLTALDQEMDQVMGYEAGADDYITKPFSLSVLLLKIEAHFRRRQEKTEAGKMISGDIVFIAGEMKVLIKSREISLTKTELKMLTFFLQNPKQILSKTQILENVFDLEGDFVDENTIAVNIRRLREKIEDNPAAPVYIKNIRGLGYIWNQEVRQ